ncbi:P-loop containing nucleoside triphosphate hydrolase protein, partial [Wilcoxina mikolae CBS 423.85]
MHTNSHDKHPRPHPHHPPSVFSTLLQHSSAPRVNTDLTVSTAIRALHPHLTLTIVPVYPCRLLEFAAAGHATATLDTDHHTPNHIWRVTADQEQVWFGKYKYKYEEKEYVVYIVEWKNEIAFDSVRMQYILSSKGDDDDVTALISAASIFDAKSHEEIWVFDGGFWERSHELWLEVQKASWDDVILDPGLKKTVIGDVEGFFGNREVYKRYSIPWKRGVIFHGPPGNGKTLSIKALMNSVSHLTNPDAPTLYVKSLTSFFGEERSISEIFSKAREVAPCLLVFEDLDSMIGDGVRSYFLNEIDGLGSNDGVCMVGSTNHLDRLDPGISKRPSRFDRKYLFPLPERKERAQYCLYWR